MENAGASLASLLEHARRRLAGTPVGRLEAEVLLAHVLGVNRAWLFAHAEDEVSAGKATAFAGLLARRERGEPLAYLTGTREFWSLSFRVTPDVLIPRPETELLVETALEHIPDGANRRIADLGTGCGAIAIAIATERPQCVIHATERSPAALRIAGINAEVHAPGRVHLHLGSWLEPLEGCFKAIVSNPPYVAGDDPHLLKGDCRFEPRNALTPGFDAMASIRHIAERALPYLEPGGLLAFEHGFDQGELVRTLLNELGYADVSTVRDLEGRERVSRGFRP
jgi:release factor glutamine methyltransferase